MVDHDYYYKYSLCGAQNLQFLHPSFLIWLTDMTHVVLSEVHGIASALTSPSQFNLCW